MAFLGLDKRWQQISAVAVIMLVIGALYVNAPKLGFATGVPEDDESYVPTVVGDPYILTTDEVWSSGEYILNGDLIIPPDRTLVIEAGVEVRALGGGGVAHPQYPYWYGFNVGIYVYGSLIVKGTYDEGQVVFTNQNQLTGSPPTYEETWLGINILPSTHYPLGGWSQAEPIDRTVHIDHANIKDAVMGVAVCGRSMYRDDPTVTISNSEIHGNWAGIMVGFALNPYHSGTFETETETCGMYFDPAVPPALRMGPAAPLIELNHIWGNHGELSGWLTDIRGPGDDPEDQDGDGWLTGIGEISEDIFQYAEFQEPIPPCCTGVHVFDSSPMIRFNEISDNEDFGVVDWRYTPQAIFELSTTGADLNNDGIPDFNIYVPDWELFPAGQTNTILYHNNLQDNGYEAWWNVQIYKVNPLYDPTGAPFQWTLFDLQTEENFVKGNSVTYFGSDPITGTAGKVETAVLPQLAEQIAGGVTPRVNPNVATGSAWEDVGPQGLPRLLYKEIHSVEGTTDVDVKFVVYDEDDSQIQEIELYWREMGAPSQVTGAINVPNLYGRPTTRIGEEYYDRLAAIPEDETSAKNPYIWHVPWEDSPDTQVQDPYTFDVPVVDGDLESMWFNLPTNKVRESGFDNVVPGVFVEDNVYLYSMADMTGGIWYMAGIVCADENDDASERVWLGSDTDGDKYYDEDLYLDLAGGGVIGGSYANIPSVMFEYGFSDYGPADEGVCLSDNSVMTFEVGVPFFGNDGVDREWWDITKDSFGLKFSYDEDISTNPPVEFFYPPFGAFNGIGDVPHYIEMVINRYDVGWHTVLMTEEPTDPNTWTASFDTGNPIDPADIELYAWAHDFHRGVNFFCHPMEDHPWPGIYIWSRDEGHENLNPYDEDVVDVTGPGGVIDISDWVDTDAGNDYVYIPAGSTLIIEDGVTVQDYDEDDIFQIVVGPGALLIADGSSGTITFEGTPTIVNFGEVFFDHVEWLGPMSTGDTKGMPAVISIAGDPPFDDNEGTMSAINVFFPFPTTNIVEVTVQNTFARDRANFHFGVEDDSCSDDQSLYFERCSLLVDYHNSESLRVDQPVVQLGGSLYAAENDHDTGEGNAYSIFLNLPWGAESEFQVQGVRGVNFHEPQLGGQCENLGGGLLGTEESCGSMFLLGIREVTPGFDLEDLDDRVDIWENIANDNEKFAAQVQTPTLYPATSSHQTEVNDHVNEWFGLGEPDEDWSANDNHGATGTSDGNDEQFDGVAVNVGTVTPPIGIEDDPDETIFCDVVCTQPGGGTEEFPPIVDIYAFDEIIVPSTTEEDSTGLVAIVATDMNWDPLTYSFSVADPGDPQSDCGELTHTSTSNAWATYTAPILPEGVDELLCRITGGANDGTTTVTDTVDVLVKKDEIIVQVTQEPAAEEEKDEDHFELIIPAWLILMILALIFTVATLYWFAGTFNLDDENRWKINNTTVGIYIVWLVLLYVILVIALGWDLDFDLGQYLQL
jgi:hypothetical protein